MTPGPRFLELEGERELIPRWGRIGGASFRLLGGGAGLDLPPSTTAHSLPVEEVSCLAGLQCAQALA